MYIIYKKINNIRIIHIYINLPEKDMMRKKNKQLGGGKPREKKTVAATWNKP